MSSHFEKALSRGGGEKDRIHTRLCEELDARSLRHLRASSRSLKGFVDNRGQIAFPEIYLYAPVRAGTTTQGIENIAPFCRSLTIKVSLPKDASIESAPSDTKSTSSKKPRRGTNALRRLDIVKKLWSSSLSLLLPPASTPNPNPSLPSLQHPDALEMDFRLWEHLFAQFPHLTHLTLRVTPSHNYPSWPGRQALEETLLLLRISLERSRPRNLQTLTCSPIHAMGLIHLRWTSFGAFREVPSRVNMRLWRNLSTLNLRVLNPLGEIDERKGIMFLGILYDYLRSFAPTLRTLQFVWLGGRDGGPSPLCLEDEAGLQHRPPLHWPRLESFWFGNLSRPNRTISLIPDVAPRCMEVKALRSAYRVSGLGDVGEGSGAWYEVPMERVVGMRGRASLAASSFYSEGGDGDEDDDDGVSRTSRVVPFVLDVKAQGEILPAKRYGG